MNEGVKISQLPKATSISDDDVVAGVVNGVTSGVPAKLLKGQKGDPGPQGEPGEPGVPGENGSDATVDIQQETGTSTTAVMSQNATTEAINAETTARTEAISAEEIARSNAITALSDKVQTDLENYYTKAQTDQMVSAIPKFAIQVVETLPTENISSTTVYLVPSGEESPNLYVEWIYVGDKWEELGKQTVDLTDYYTKEEVSENFVAKSDFIITEQGQTRANNLPQNTVYYIDDNNTSTATQAIMIQHRNNLIAGVTGDTNLLLPMASTTQAGCVTAAEYKIITNAVRVLATNESPESTGLTSITQIKQIAATFTLPEHETGTYVLQGKFSIRNNFSGSGLYKVLLGFGVDPQNPSAAYNGINIDERIVNQQDFFVNQKVTISSSASKWYCTFYVTSSVDSEKASFYSIGAGSLHLLKFP